MTTNPYRTLEKEIGYTFRRRSLLEVALTHPSFRYEARASLPDNQRLEFLGDAALGIAAAAHMYRAYPEYEEGELTRLRSIVASMRALADIASGIHLGDYLRLGRGESQSGGQRRASNLADALEAVLGAAFLDGGLPAIHRIFRKLFQPRLAALALQGSTDNPKGALQEWSQARELGNPRYRVVHETGPAHAPTYTVEVSVHGRVLAIGCGANKREAESAAAASALPHLQTTDGSHPS